MEKMQLAEQKNAVQIIGEIKSIKLNWGKKDKNGREFVSGNMVIKTTNEYGVGEHRLNIMQYKIAKSSGNVIAFYKALKTIDNEYETIEKNGKGRMVRVLASVEDNPYYNAKKDEVVESLSLKPNRISSLTEEEIAKERQGVLITASGFLDKIFEDEEGKVTCRLTTVNFFGNIIPIKAEIKPDLAEKFLEKFEDRSCVKMLKMEMVKAAKISEEAPVSEIEEDDMDDFGDCEEISSEIITDYINTIIVIGGKTGFDPALELDEEAIDEAYKQRELLLQEKLEEGRKINKEDDFSSDEGFDDESDEDGDDLPF